MASDRNRNSISLQDAPTFFDARDVSLLLLPVLRFQRSIIRSMINDVENATFRKPLEILSLQFPVGLRMVLKRRSFGRYLVERFQMEAAELRRKDLAYRKRGIRSDETVKKLLEAYDTFLASVIEELRQIKDGRDVSDREKEPMSK